MVNRLNFLLELKLDTYCPTKTIRLSNLDGKVSSTAVKQACRRKNREYLKNGNSEKYKRLKKIVKIKLKEATAKIINKQVENVSVKNNSWLKHVKNITAKPGENNQATFTLPKHIEEGLSALESSDKICEYFSAISQETLPPRGQSKLQNDSCNHPQLKDYIVYEGLKKGKKTSSVPGDMPKKILEAHPINPIQ